MHNSEFTVEQFRAVTLARFSFLEARGFHRKPTLEKTTSAGGSVVYLGKNVGFIFSLDMRDQCIDGQVVKIRDGQLKWNWDGGYSSDIFVHLVSNSGYRSGFRSQNQPHESRLEQMVEGWVEMLQQAGQVLLNDLPDSLPR